MQIPKGSQSAIASPYWLYVGFGLCSTYGVHGGVIVPLAYVLYLCLISASAVAAEYIQKKDKVSCQNDSGYNDGCLQQHDQCVNDRMSLFVEAIDPVNAPKNQQVKKQIPKTHYLL